MTFLTSPRRQQIHASHVERGDNRYHRSRRHMSPFYRALVPLDQTSPSPQTAQRNWYANLVYKPVL